MYDLKYIQTDDINFQMKKKPYILKQNFKLCRILQGHFVKKKIYRRGRENLGALSLESTASLRLTFIINHRRTRSLPASATRLFSKKLEYLNEDGL